MVHDFKIADENARAEHTESKFCKLDKVQASTTREQYLELKSELKQLAKANRTNRINYKRAQREGYEKCLEEKFRVW